MVTRAEKTSLSGCPHSAVDSRPSAVSPISLLSILLITTVVVGVLAAAWVWNYGPQSYDQGREAAYAEIRAALWTESGVLPGPRPKRIPLSKIGIDFYLVSDNGPTRQVILHDRW